MLFNEKEMLDICKKYGIDVVEKKGYPLFNGKEMDENFSMCEIMNNACCEAVNKKIIYSETLEIQVSIDFEGNDYTNCSLNSLDKPYFIKTDNSEQNRGVKSLMVNNNNISIAA